MIHTPLGPGREFDLIRRFIADAGTNANVLLGPGDDCALINGEHIALSTDMAVESVHFRRDWMSAEEIGYRSAVTALSDLAAMAAQPIGLLVSLAAPAADVPAFAESVMAGVRAVCTEYDCALLGGDLTRSPRGLVINLTVVGTAMRAVTRAGARAGDSVWVTGSLGGAAAAIRVASRGRKPGLDARVAYVHPRARIREALWLADRGIPNALIDVSDGLAGDAGHIAAASGVRIVLRGAQVPVHAAARRVRGGPRVQLMLALTGGDDYELCFTARPGAVEAVESRFLEELGTPITRIGSVEEGDGVYLEYDGATERLVARGYQHFAEAAR